MCIRDSINYAAKQRAAGGYGENSGACSDPIAGTNAGDVAERHRKQAAIAEADDLEGQPFPMTASNFADLPDAARGTC